MGQNDTATIGVERGVYYTEGNGGEVYAFAMGWPDSTDETGNTRLKLEQPACSSSPEATLLGNAKVRIGVRCNRGGKSGVTLVIPPMNVRELPSLHGPWVFRLAGF